LTLLHLAGLLGFLLNTKNCLVSVIQCDLKLLNSRGDGFFWLIDSSC
jgi:hypothetical protein